LILDLRKLAADYPALPGYRASLASGLRGMGNTLRKLGRLSDAEQTYRESLAIYAKLAEGPYATAVDAFNLGTAMLGLARVANAGGRSSEAQQIIERAMTTIKPAVQSNPGNYSYQRMWHRAMRWQLSLAAARGEHEEGARWVGRIAGSGLASAKELADCGWRMGQLTWLVWRDGRLGQDEKWRTTQGHASRAVRLFSAAGIQLCREWFLAPATPAVKGMELEE
jgi:tetratricopeptide (TPR) repeat protein